MTDREPLDVFRGVEVVGGQPVYPSFEEIKSAVDKFLRKIEARPDQESGLMLSYNTYANLLLGFVDEWSDRNGMDSELPDDIKSKLKESADVFQLGSQLDDPDFSFLGDNLRELAELGSPKKFYDKCVQGVRDFQTQILKDYGKEGEPYWLARYRKFLREGGKIGFEIKPKEPLPSSGLGRVVEYDEFTFDQSGVRPRQRLELAKKTFIDINDTSQHVFRGLGLSPKEDYSSKVRPQYF